MKIGVLGNMNNISFALVRYLRNKGYDCELLIFKNEPELFHPSSDTSASDYHSYCRYLSWGDPADFLSVSNSQVRNDVAPYQFLIGQGPAPAYMARIGRALDVFMPYGFDLYSLPFYRIVHPMRMPAYLATRYYQRKGIRQAGKILFDKTNPAFEKIFDRLGIQHKHMISPLPMLYAADYEMEVRDADWEQITGIKRSGFTVIQHIRQVWKKSPDRWSFKGNDLLIKGFALFAQKHQEANPVLFLFAYGTDVERSKELATQLGIAHRVIWFPKMARKELIPVLKGADLIVGELHHSWFSYGGMMEALSLGKPLMHNRDDAFYKDHYAELYPNFYAGSVATVAAGLEHAWANRDSLPRIGAEGRAWFEKYCVERPLEIITSLIENRRSAAGT